MAPIRGIYDGKGRERGESSDASSKFAAAAVAPSGRAQERLPTMAASPVTLLHCDFHLGRPLLHVALRAALGLGLREKGIGGEGERIGTVRPEKVFLFLFFSTC